MNQPWQVFARVLTMMLAIVLLFTIAAIGWEIHSVGGQGAAVLTAWYGGIGRDGSSAINPDASDGAVLLRDDNGTTALSGLSTIAMVLFAAIPFITYAATAMSFARHRRWAYLVMALFQIAVLSVVAIPVVLGIVTSYPGP